MSKEEHSEKNYCSYVKYKKECNGEDCQCCSIYLELFPEYNRCM